MDTDSGNSRRFVPFEMNSTVPKPREDKIHIITSYQVGMKSGGSALRFASTTEVRSTLKMHREAKVRVLGPVLEKLGNADSYPYETPLLIEVDDKNMPRHNATVQKRSTVSGTILDGRRSIKKRKLETSDQHDLDKKFIEDGHKMAIRAFIDKSIADLHVSAWNSGMADVKDVKDSKTWLVTPKATQYAQTEKLEFQFVPSLRRLKTLSSTLSTKYCHKSSAAKVAVAIVESGMSTDLDYIFERAYKMSPQVMVSKHHAGALDISFYTEFDVHRAGKPSVPNV